MNEPTVATLSPADRDLAYLLIDVQRGKVGILTAVRRVREMQAETEGALRQANAELFMWHHSQCYCCRQDGATCVPGCRCHRETT